MGDPTNRRSVAGAALPDLSGALARFVADAAVHEAARSWTVARSLEAQASEDATITGVLLDLAERGRPVVLTSGSGRRHRGRLRMVGRDFCMLRTDAGLEHLVSSAALGTVRPLPGDPATVGDRASALDLSLVDALGYLGRDRPRLRIGLIGESEPVTGELRNAGRDVLALRLDGDPPPTAYVNIAMVAEVAIAS